MPVADNGSDEPTKALGFIGVIAIEDSMAALTETVVVAVFPFKLAEMTALPAPMPVTNPVEVVTLATSGVAEVNTVLLVTFVLVPLE